MGKLPPNQQHKFCPYCGGMTERYLTIAEVAELTGQSPETWRKRLKERAFDYVKIGRSVRIAWSSIRPMIKKVPAINSETIDTL